MAVTLQKYMKGADRSDKSTRVALIGQDTGRSDRMKPSC